jgi:2-iminobutanoate/2-iminopropanoate deaminase
MRPSLVAASLALVLIAVPGELHGQAAMSMPNAQSEKQQVEGVVASIGYAQAIRVGNTIHVSGAVAPGATMEEQVKGIYERLAFTLGRFGATLKDVVKETAFATDIEALKAANPARRAAYGTHAPAATWVQISRLDMPSALVEIEVTAVVGSAR